MNKGWAPRLTAPSSLRRINLARLVGAAAVLALLPVCSAALTKPGEALRERQLHDLEVARTAYILKSKAFTPHARAGALALVAQLKRQAGELSDARFLLGMLQLTALTNNAHDSVDFGDDAWNPPTRTPFRMLWFPGAMLVARAAPVAADLLGATVVRVEGLTPEALLARLRSLNGGKDAYLKWDMAWVIEDGGMLYGLGVAKDPASLMMEFRLPSGRAIERRIAFIPSNTAARGAGPVGNWSPVASDDEQAKRWSVATKAPAPLYLAQIDRLFRTTELSDLNALYVQFRANYDAGDQKIAAFVDAVETRIQRTAPQNLVLDLRFDIGGDIDQTRNLMRNIAHTVPGRIYVLVGRYTFSAGIASAAAMKHDAADRVTVVGEELGDRLRWWSEIDTACLPNSHICMHSTHGLWDLQKGCAGEPHCYGDQYDATVGDLAPDVWAPLTATAWLSGRDPGLEAVREALAASHNGQAEHSSSDFSFTGPHLGSRCPASRQSSEAVPGRSAKENRAWHE